MSFAFDKKMKVKAKKVDYVKLAKKHCVKVTKKTPSGGRKAKSQKELKRHVLMKMKSKSKK